MQRLFEKYSVANLFSLCRDMVLVFEHTFATAVCILCYSIQHKLRFWVTNPKILLTDSSFCHLAWWLDHKCFGSLLLPGNLPMMVVSFPGCKDDSWWLDNSCFIPVIDVVGLGHMVSDGRLMLFTCGWFSCGSGEFYVRNFLNVFLMLFEAFPSVDLILCSSSFLSSSSVTVQRFSRNAMRKIKR